MENTEINLDQILGSLENTESPAEFNLADYLVPEKQEEFNQNFFGKFGTDSMNGLVSKISEAEALKARLDELEATKQEIHPLLQSFGKHVEGLDAKSAMERILTIMEVNKLDELNGEELAIKFLKYSHPSYSNQEIQDLLNHKVYGEVPKEGEGIETIKKEALESFNKIAKSEIEQLKVSFDTNVNSKVAAAETEQKLDSAMFQISSRLVSDKIEIEGLTFGIEGKDEYANAVATYLKQVYKQDPTVFQDANRLKEVSQEYTRQLYFAANYKTIIATLKESLSATSTRAAVNNKRSNVPPKNNATQTKKASWRAAFGK
jgi:hypothetical protein